MYILPVHKRKDRYVYNFYYKCNFHHKITIKHILNGNDFNILFISINAHLNLQSWFKVKVHNDFKSSLQAMNTVLHINLSCSNVKHAKNSKGTLISKG